MSSEIIKSLVQTIDPYVHQANSRYALVLYLEGPSPASFSLNLPETILILKIRDLLSSLLVKSFAKIVLDLRNRRVHGIGF